MAGYVINSEDQPFKSGFTHGQGWPGVTAFYHEIEYSFGGTQYKVKIIAESFEVARNIIANRYGHIKGFNLDTQMVGSPATTLIGDVSPYMKRELIKAWSKQIDVPSEKKTSLSDRLFRK